MTSGVGPRRASIRLHEAAALGLITVAPLLLGGRGLVNADTNQYLYLDPYGLMERARTIWDTKFGGGGVTHQTVGYLWPMGPFHGLADSLGLPDWFAERLWAGGLQFFAALGALALFRHVLPRTWVHLPAAAAYGLSPLLLASIATESSLLVPFAGLGWLVLYLARALEEPPSWRWPAAFALVVTTCGSINGSSVLFVVLAAVLWVPVAVAQGTATRRDGARVLVRAGTLTLVTQLWWIVAYAIDGRYNLPILRMQETVATTNATTSAPEILRGLGAWLFYGGDTEGLWLRDIATPYLTTAVLLAVTFTIPVLALVASTFLRWRYRAYFVVLITVGVVLAVGAFPIGDSSPAGAAFQELSHTSDFVLALRNTKRASVLVSFGLAGLLAGGLGALQRRHARAGAAAALAVLLLVGLAIPAQWRTGLVAERFHREEELPDAWLDAARDLDTREGRVLELPGSDFAAYRWGYTRDPVSVGLTDRPYVTRELIPTGGDAGADLLEALDRGLQEGWFEPAALAPVARLLGATEVLVRNDLAYERYRIVRPRVAWPLLSSSGAGLDLVATYGDGYENVAGPGRPMIDEIELGLDTGGDLPQLAVFAVPGLDRPALTAEPIGGGVVIDGDGEGVVAAAAAGLLDRPGAVLLGADVVRGGDADAVVDGDTLVVLTDTNRKRAKRWYSLRENAGATEPADGPAALDDPNTSRLEVAGTTPPGTQTVIEWRGIERVWADAYGSLSGLLPEERPVNAIDGDPTTAWRSERGADGSSRRWGVELLEPSQADLITLVAPQDRLGTVPVTRVQITLDGERQIDATLPADATGPTGVDVRLDGEPFTRLELEVLAPTDGLAGFAEVVLPGVRAEELVRLPTALVDELGSGLAGQPVAIVLTRQRANPAEPLRADPEPAMVRLLTLPVALDLALSGTARLDTNAPEPVLDELLGAGDDAWGVRATSTARLPGDLDARASSVLDGDLTTAWQTPLSAVEGQAIELALDAPVTLDALELDVVDDGQHSLPSSLRLYADGGAPIELEVPAAAEPAPDGSGTRHLRLPLPSPTTASTWRLEVAGVDVRSTTDWTTMLPFTLPIGIAEVALPGVPLRPAPSVVDTGCRTDLVTIADQPVPVRISGDPDDAATAGSLALEACPPDVAVAEGETILRTSPGRATGLGIDRLVLADDGAAPVEPAGPALDVTTSSHRPGRATGTIESDGRPFWLVLDESMNDGWELDVEDATVEGPRPIDSFASGWLVTPTRSGTLAVDARFAPQRALDLGLIASALGALVCAGLVILGRRGTPRPIPDGGAPLLGMPSGAPPLWAAVVAAVLAGLLVAPAAAPLVAGLVVAARRWPRAARVVPVIVIAGSVAGVVLLEAARQHPASFVWPRHFEWAHRPVLAAVLALAVLVLVPDRDDHRRQRRASSA